MLVQPRNGGWKRRAVGQEERAQGLVTLGESVVEMYLHQLGHVGTWHQSWVAKQPPTVSKENQWVDLQ